MSEKNLEEFGEELTDDQWKSLLAEEEAQPLISEAEYNQKIADLEQGGEMGADRKPSFYNEEIARLKEENAQLVIENKRLKDGPLQDMDTAPATTKKFSRRTFLKGVGVGAVATVVATEAEKTGLTRWLRNFFLGDQGPQPGPDPDTTPTPTPEPSPTMEPTAEPTQEIEAEAQVEKIPSPERRPAGETTFGFHLRLNGEYDQENPTATLDNFKEDLEVLNQINTPVARFALRPWHTVFPSSADEVKWKQGSMDTFKAGLEVAKEKGIDTILTTAVPEHAHIFSDEDYLAYTEKFYAELVGPSQLHGLARVVQIENEANVHNFRYDKDADPPITYGGKPDMDNPQYNFEMLRKVIESGRRGIKASDEKVLVTTSFSYAFRGEDLEDAKTMFTTLGDSVDIVTINFYPTEGAINQIPGILRQIYEATGKPIAIGELGLPSQYGGEQRQGQVISQSLEAIKQAQKEGIPIDDVVVYELRDNKDNADPGVTTFGVMTIHRNPKAESFSQIANAMKLEDDTPPSIGPTPTPLG